jgi:uncharacterized SAM-binding protein YcdF (DUF218 family)
MLFFLRKLIEALLLPIGVCGLLSIAGVVVRRRWIAMAGVVMLFALSTPIVGRLMLYPLERVYAPIAAAAAPNVDAIVVLSGGITRGITASGVQWGESANRFFAGIDLAIAGKARVIVISAGMFPFDGVVLQQIAIRDGVSPERIIVTPRVLTTDDEARAVSKIPAIHSILLVTSAFHMPRSVLLFRARGLDVTPFPTDERVLGTWTLTSSEFIPSSAGLDNSDGAIREYYGLAVYHTVLFFRPAGL